MFTKKTIKDINVANQTVLVRTILNVPIKNNQVTDKTRLIADKPTIEYLLEQNAGVVLISHHSDEKQSLASTAPILSEIVRRPIKFMSDCIGTEVEAAVKGLQPGEIIMLENLRFHPEEKANDPAFAQKLASYGSIFVEDDFTNCHREHASMIGVPKYVKEAVAGLSVVEEVESITSALEKPKRPVVAVTGGAKISTKVPILSFLLAKVDAVFIGGAMANTFLLAQGHEVGKSLVEADQVEAARQIMAKAAQEGKQILLPLDVVVTTSLENPTDIRRVGVNEVGADDIIADVGPQSVAQLVNVLDPNGSVIWNGPVGIFETPAFASGTEAVAQAIINSGAYSLIGGGDTLNYIDAAGLHDKFSFVSTGGGASLELMSGHPLPGVEVLMDKN